MKVSLFVTCLVDQFFPEVGESVVQVLRRLGVEVDFPLGQTCCGQPAYNAGFHKEARRMARRLLDLFPGDDPIVVPSGSCASMLKVFLPDLFSTEPPPTRSVPLVGRKKPAPIPSAPPVEQKEAEPDRSIPPVGQQEAELKEKVTTLGQRVYEFSEFLIQVLGVTNVGAYYNGRVAYHASCHLLRELNVRQEPTLLIQGVQGAQLVEMDRSTDCCGFGGAFAVRYPEISAAILEEKLQAFQASGAQALVSCEMGCLMQIGGAMTRRNMPSKTLHLAQLLAQNEASGG